jgi:hypothetical protein
MMRRMTGKGLAIGSLFLLALQSESVYTASASMMDETLESKVERRLRMEGRIRWDDLRVEAVNGQVTLYGVVKSNDEKGIAAKAASTVEGVSEIVNRLIVEPALPSAGQASEAQIEEESRDRVIEGPPGLKDRQILP